MRVCGVEGDRVEEEVVKEPLQLLAAVDDWREALEVIKAAEEREVDWSGMVRSVRAMATSEVERCKCSRGRGFLEATWKIVPRSGRTLFLVLSLTHSLNQSHSGHAWNSAVLVT